MVRHLLSTLPPLPAFHDWPQWLLVGAGIFLAVHLLCWVWRVSTQRKRDEKRRAKWAAKMKAVNDLYKLTPDEFEEYTAAVFLRMGWKVDRIGGRGADGGVDLMLSRKEGCAVVQCKRYKSAVGEPVLRDLVGTMMHHGAAKGYCVALSGFTRSAEEWAKGKKITLISGPWMVKYMNRENVVLR